MKIFMSDLRSWMHLFNPRFHDTPAVEAVKQLSAKLMRKCTARSALVDHMSDVLIALGCQLSPAQATLQALMDVLTEDGVAVLEWCGKRFS